MLRRKAFTAFLAASFMSLSLLAYGCGGGGERTTEVVLGKPAPQGAFALYYPVASSTTPRVPAYSVAPGLSGVEGARQAGLAPEVASALAAQGFAAVAGSADTLYGAYEAITGPRFVSVDALTYTLDRLCAHVLGDVEERFLAAELNGLVRALFDTSMRMYEGCEGTVKDAALANLAYLAVAARLLGADVDVPSELAGAVEEELSLIAGMAGTSPSPLFAYAQDYGRYAPPGRYRDGGTLEGYFQAMTWLGCTGFYPRPGNGPADVTAGRGMARQVLLLVGALHMAEVDGERAYEAWDRIYRTTSFFTPCAVDLDADTCTRVAREVFGDSFPLSRLGDDALVDGFATRALEERMPRLATLAAGGYEVAEPPAAFRLFAQPCHAEDLVFAQLVSPRVAERFMPRGLDLPAALGSDRALDILDRYYGENAYEGYAENMNGLRSLFRAIDPAQVNSNLYWSRLDVLRLLLEPYGEGYPAFMRAPSWEDHGLYSFLGAWADMRRDGAPLAAVSGAGGTPARDAARGGYVEPVPEAYARLAAVADMIRRGLDGRGMASAPARERLDALYGLVLELKTMAEKELRGEALSDEEYAAIADIGGTMRYLVTFPAGGGEAGELEADASPSLATSVYTDESFGESLQAAAGSPLVYYVVVPVEGRLVLATGAGYSYYEFVKPADGTVSGEEWREMLEAGRLPDRPAWSSSFLR